MVITFSSFVRQPFSCTYRHRFPPSPRFATALENKMQNKMSTLWNANSKKLQSDIKPSLPVIVGAGPVRVANRAICGAPK